MLLIHSSQHEFKTQFLNKIIQIGFKRSLGLRIEKKSIQQVPLWYNKTKLAFQGQWVFKHLG